MNVIFENISYMVMLIVIVMICVLYIIHFSKLSKEERYEQIRGWLLQAVILAEKEFGSGTGALKLSSVYNQFCRELPWLAQTVPFSRFSKYVDDALNEMKSIVKNNEKIAAVLGDKGED